MYLRGSKEPCFLFFSQCNWVSNFGSNLKRCRDSELFLFGLPQMNFLETGCLMPLVFGYQCQFQRFSCQERDFLGYPPERSKRIPSYPYAKPFCFW